MSEQTVIPVNQHFLDLVEQGQHDGCSESERNARTLAIAILDAVPGFDATATRGLKEWIDYVKKRPSSARDLVGVWD